MTSIRADHHLNVRLFYPRSFSQTGNKLAKLIDRLMFAVLNDAIRCYQNQFWGSGSGARRSLAETKQWLFGL